MICQTYCFPFLDPHPMECPVKLQLSVYLSVSLEFFSGIACWFFIIFGTMVDNWNLLKAFRPFFPGKFFLVQIMGQNAARQSYCRIL